MHKLQAVACTSSYRIPMELATKRANRFIWECNIVVMAKDFWLETAELA